jgi:hypothetical protein
MKITKELFEHAMDFETYDKHVKELFALGKTTGDNQTQNYIDFTKLGIQRVKRGLKTTTIEDKVIETLNRTKAINWLVITEAWCGDAANSLPIIVKLAEARKDINLKLILRDSNSEVMNSYLTNGAKAIPVVIFLDDDFNELALWGPRPEPAQKMALENKAHPVMSQQDFNIALQKWYISDKSQTTQHEFQDILENLE